MEKENRAFLWFVDEEMEASGRMLLNASEDHYLTVENAVTAGSLILEELVRKFLEFGFIRCLLFVDYICFLNTNIPSPPSPIKSYGVPGIGCLSL